MTRERSQVIYERGRNQFQDSNDTRKKVEYTFYVKVDSCGGEMRSIGAPSSSVKTCLLVGVMSIMDVCVKKEVKIAKS